MLIDSLITSRRINLLFPIPGKIAIVQKDTLKCWINVDFLYLATVYDIVIMFGTASAERNNGVHVR